ncbi:cysteine hydrolase family protein [Geomicrobium sp. JCM 19039]|uniref:cysteine hydrolase family protein n=1 Tax=Geomicrobium sp. JCM 19039 TaxID=1460636 RepID=UPI00045F236E|nr:isochorismatase family cysteine hydrolase [Geomicrobium sp. JCM 19039]GAK14194.1 isochorismatase [Geomicrobium sp. JCM 19039]
MITKNDVLLLIDIQKGFHNPKLGTPHDLGAIENMRGLLKLWRKNKSRVIHIQHTPKERTSLFHSSKEGHDFMDGFVPENDEICIQKPTNSAFIGTDLEQVLNDNHAERVYVIGLTTPHCVSTTVRMSGNLGFSTVIIEDATVSFPIGEYDGETVQKLTIATLKDEFASVKTTEQIKELFMIENETDGRRPHQQSTR